MEEKDITLSVAEKMLSYVDSTDREIWYKMAAALKNHFGEDGRSLYHEWSAKAKNYNKKAADSQFNSARYGSNNIWFLKNRATERGWQPDKTYQPTAAEIEQQQQKLAQAEKKRQKEERERAKKQANASRKAKWVWENRAKTANPKHPYLVKKGISDPTVLQYIRQSGDNLIIPLKQGKEVVGMQMIFPNGRKHIPADTPKKGSALFLGDTHLDNLKQGFYMAEGFATSASIVSATGRPCLMCIDGGNLPTVALTIKEMVNKHQISVWVAADINDGSVQNPNVGVKHAKEVVAILGETAQFITPDFSDDEVREWKSTHDNKPPTDFNDLQLIGGVERVKNALANTFRQPEQSVLKENQMTEKELLLQMLDSQDIELRKNAAINAMADDEVLHKAFLDEEDEVRRAAILNPNASDKFLSKIFDKANPIEKSLMIHHAHIDAHTLKMAIEDGSSDMFVIANHHNANESVLEKLLREVAQENVKTTAAKRLQKEYGWREEQFLALEQKETQEYVSGSLNNFEQRQNEINQQKADLQNKLDELQKQQEAVNNLQVQLTQEQLDEIDKKFEEIYKQQAELDRQIDELQIERRQVLGQA
ncbi:MAG: PriCT-2 domain-containing protein, partial [Neisseriaceae bacterium]|nr:PriCT-2 domain-containing protein [Neisseriaceae bacterium]